MFTNFPRRVQMQDCGPIDHADRGPRMIQHLIEDLAKSLGQWAYLLVALMAMAETAAFLGFIAPGEFAVIFGGVLAGEGTLSIELLIGIVWAAVVAGDTIGFLIGRRYGRGFAERYGPKVRLTEDRLKKVEGYFDRHGGKTIFFGRWIGFTKGYDFTIPPGIELEFPLR